MVMPRLVTRRQAAGAIVVAVLSVLCSTGLCIAAVLVHPPIAVDPLVVIACVGFPVLGTWELPPAIAMLRANRRAHSKRRLIANLRQALDQLPETDHPFGH